MKYKLEYIIHRAKYYFTDSIPFYIARKMPRKLVYYAIIRAWTYASTNEYSNKTPDKITWDMVCRLEDKF